VNDTPAPTVRPGQVWADNDKRTSSDPRGQRYIYVHSVGHDGRATCEAWYGDECGNSRTVRIRLDRFRPTATGYRLVTDVPATDTAEESRRA